MNTAITILIVIVALLLASVIALVILSRASAKAHSRELSLIDEERDSLRKTLSDTERRLNEETMRLRQTEMERETLRIRYDQMQRDREQNERQLKSEFRNLAQEILTEHQAHLRQTNRDSLDLLLKPFKDNITEFRERVESIYAHENEQRGALKNELDNLIKLNQQMTSSAASLTDALKGNSKVQGDWGEAYLETILESTGLLRDIHYRVQPSYKDEDGVNLRPDIVLNLPEERRIVIDSKVSLTDYVRYTEAESEAERSQALKNHVESVRKHMLELAAKSYQRLVESPDFVVMFVPTEPAFLEALKADNSIWSDGYSRKVIISSPTNLFALLKMVADMWRRDAQSKNQVEIVEKATKLYEQLVVFSEQLEGVGSALSDAQKCYNEAYKRLHTGNNNIVRLGERLKRLGLPTKKSQKAQSIAEADYDPEQDE